MMKKNRVRLTESQLHRVIKESVAKVLTEMDIMSMPLNADAIGRNNWWKQQVDTDFPNHGINNSNNWQDEYYKMQGQKDADAKAAAKNAKHTEMEQYKELGRNAYTEFKDSVSEDDTTGEMGYMVFSPNYNAKCYIYDKGSFNLIINGQNYDDEILYDGNDIKKSGDKDEITAYFIAKAANKLSKELFRR